MHWERIQCNVLQSRPKIVLKLLQNCPKVVSDVRVASKFSQKCPLMVAMLKTVLMRLSVHSLATLVTGSDFDYNHNDFVILRSQPEPRFVEACCILKVKHCIRGPEGSISYLSFTEVSVL